MVTVQLSCFKPCENDHLLFQSLHHLLHLTKLTVGCTEKGAQELSMLLATIKEVQLHYSNLYDHPRPFQSCSAAEAALCSSSITSLSTNFGFNISSIETIVSIELDMQYTSSRG